MKSQYTWKLARRLLKKKLAKTEVKRVVDHIESREPISQNPADLLQSHDSFWDRLADNVAKVGGSWGFIAGFFSFLLFWVLLNTWLLIKPWVFDPYPFIFLNLMLSMLAAVQAPIIMMSQNRQAQKDRIAANHGYEVSLRSEIEILAMQDKLNELRVDQFEALMTQQQQILERLTHIDRQLK